MASIPFDRAAEYYDRTRTLSPGTMAQLLSLLRSELDGRQPCLEIGVGTGRLALPLHESGIRMAGVDLSIPMLGKLREKAGGSLPFPVAVADALALPFEDRSFGAGLAVHVLHVVEDWRRALAELVRVVRPGGVVLVDVGAGELGGGARSRTGSVRKRVSRSVIGHLIRKRSTRRWLRWALPCECSVHWSRQRRSRSTN